MTTQYSLAALIAAGRAYSSVKLAATEAREAVKREANSGQLTRLFFASLVAKEYDRAREALGADAAKDSGAREVWNRIKGRASESVFLFDYLSNGKGIPAGAGKAWKIDGRPVAAVTREHIASLAAPGNEDTGIATLIKAARERAAFVEESRELAAKRDTAALAAFLRTPTGQMEFPGEDISSLRAILSPHQLVAVLDSGAEELAREEKAASVKAASDARRDQIATLAGAVASMSESEMDSLVALIAARRATLAPVQNVVATNDSKPGARTNDKKAVNG